MKIRTFPLALIAATLGFATVAQAQNSEWEQRDQQRRWRVEQQRQLERQRWEWQQRHLGAPAEREHQRIDTRTQSLPPAPAGHEWRRSDSGDFVLIHSASGVAVQVVRNVTPTNGSPQ